MTLGNAKQQIFNLGFETFGSYTEEPTILIDALNRAMRDITNTFPLLGKYQISQNPLPNLLPFLQSQDARKYSGVPLEYHAQDARSFTFECDGIGTLTITDADGERVLALDSRRVYKTYRGFLRGDSTLIFSGPFSYNVKNIAIYAEAYSDLEQDIPPFRRFVRYDFKELTKIKGNPDATPPTHDVFTFIDFADKIQEGDSTEGATYRNAKDFHIEDRSVLVLDGFARVQYTIFYKKNFTALTEATQDDFVFELDFDKEHLLPLLAAWYVWADDEPSKASKWRNDYEDFVAKSLGEASPNNATEAFENDLRW